MHASDHRPARDESNSPFSALGLSDALLRSLAREGYTEPTPIQSEAIPHVLAGRDLLASAQTGTGKTAAFVLPLLEGLGPNAAGGELRALVLSPTRELASQIAERAEAYGRHLALRHTVIFGGVSQHKQERALARRPAMIVATPGRLLDLMGQGIVRLDTVDMLVLDEADRMFDMGFLPDVRRIVAALPAERQTLLFSATMTSQVSRLGSRILRDPVQVSVARSEQTGEIDESLCFLSSSEKRSTLVRCIGADDVERAIVFTRTKRGANSVAEQLLRAGISASAIHGNKSQSARERALDGFRRGKTPILVATDVAARGIDVKDVTHVFNYDLPDSAESYVHRIGRTARAGRTGKAISFCDVQERGLLFDIERGLRKRIPVVCLASGVGEPVAAAPSPAPRRADPSRSYRRSRRPGGGRAMFR